MRTIILFFVFMLLVPQAQALKYRTYTLAELTKGADAIVVAKITVRDGVIHAEVLRSLKGNPGIDIIVDSYALREDEKARFKDQEAVILFLQKEEGGRRLLLGYGDQGKWPKIVGEWPYSDVHVVPIQAVEKAVKTLLDLDQLTDSDAKVGKIRLLLSSKDAFDQSVALEYLETERDQKLKDAVKSDVDFLRGTTKDNHIKNIANSVTKSSTSKKP